MSGKFGIRVPVLVMTSAVLVAGIARADAPTPVWTKTIAFDLRSASVAVDQEGNAYVSGSRVSETESVAVLKKFDPDGQPLWTRTWSQIPAHTSGELVAVDTDSSVYFAGSVGSNHFEGGAWFLRKYDADGNLEWARDERGWQHGRTADFPTGLAVTDHQVVMSGSFQGCCGDYRILDGWVLAFGRDGSWRWRSPFEAPGLGAFSDEAEGVTVGESGGIYVGGWAALGPENDAVAAGHELFLQKLDRGGRVQWSQVYPATAHVDQHFGADLAVHDHALMVSALFDGSPVTWARARPGHAWLGRFTLSGDLVWSRHWGSSWVRAVQPSVVSVDEKGHTFVVGTRRDPSDHGLDASLRRYSTSGDLAWSLPLQHGHRLMEGTGVAVRGGTLFVTTEALKMRFGHGLKGYWLQKFA